MGQESDAPSNPTPRAISIDNFREATAEEKQALVHQHLQMQMAQALYCPENASAEEMEQLVMATVALRDSIKPADNIEAMLAAQMVATHAAAMECLRRAARLKQTLAGVDMALRHAEKLMGIYNRQVEVLNRHRGKGQQKVTVEHVHVAAGGQAVVGHVETTARLEHSQAGPEAMAPIVQNDRETAAPKRSPVRRRRTGNGNGKERS